MRPGKDRQKHRKRDCDVRLHRRSLVASRPSEPMLFFAKPTLRPQSLTAWTLNFYTLSICLNAQLWGSLCQARRASGRCCHVPSPNVEISRDFVGQGPLETTLTVPRSARQLYKHSQRCRKDWLTLLSLRAVMWRLPIPKAEQNPSPRRDAVRAKGWNETGFWPTEEFDDESWSNWQVGCWNADWPRKSATVKRRTITTCQKHPSSDVGLDSLDL